MFDLCKNIKIKSNVIKINYFKFFYNKSNVIKINYFKFFYNKSNVIKIIIYIFFMFDLL